MTRMQNNEVIFDVVSVPLKDPQEKVLFSWEEIVQAAAIDVRGSENLADSRRVVAVCKKEVARGFNEFCFCCLRGFTHCIS